MGKAVVAGTAGVAGVAATTAALLAAFPSVRPATVGFLYLLIIVAVAAYAEARAALLVAAVAVPGFLLFLPPVGSLRVARPQDWLSTAIFTSAAVITVLLVQSGRRSAVAAERRWSAPAERQKQILDTVLGATADLIYMLDGDARFLYASQAGLKIMQLPAEAVIGKTWRDLKFPPEIFEPFEAQLKQVMASGEAHSTSITVPGSDRTIEYAIVPARRGTSVDAVVVTARETSEQTRLEWQLRESEERFRLLVGAVKDYAIFMLDPEGRVVSWTVGAQRIKQYAAEEVIGKHFSIFYTAQDVAAGKPERGLELARREGSFEDIGLRVRKDGSQFWADVVITAVHDEEGILRGFAKVTRDITVQRENAEAVARHTASLARSNAELERFAYVASHDLQEPLRAVSSYAQILERRYGEQLDSEGREFLGFIVEGAQRMRNLIHALLEYSRVASQNAEPAPLESAEALRDALDNLATAIQDSGAQVSYDHLPVVMGDTSQLTQLFQNLIANAIKFRGRQAPRIAIGAEERDGQWLFSVRDNGIGIDKKYADRIFQLFQRLHTRSEYPGTGIGLAICQKIVELHGGRIWVESTPGEGATFFFTLPARPALTGARSAKTPLQEHRRA